jgi:hypothetical protein
LIVLLLKCYLYPCAIGLAIFALVGMCTVAVRIGGWLCAIVDKITG